MGKRVTRENGKRKGADERIGEKQQTGKIRILKEKIKMGERGEEEKEKVETKPTVEETWKNWREKEKVDEIEDEGEGGKGEKRENTQGRNKSDHSGLLRDQGFRSKWHHSLSDPETLVPQQPAWEEEDQTGESHPLKRSLLAEDEDEGLGPHHHHHGHDHLAPPLDPVQGVQ